ncbi:MAG: hypothetical protein HN919_09030, partial [Verrucomicrobia bacterium]|nr:hypothetical protein [Verrucomicrobiota bacterium]
MVKRGFLSVLLPGYLFLCLATFAQEITMSATVDPTTTAEGVVNSNKFRVTGSITGSTLHPKGQLNIGNDASVMLEYIDAGGTYRTLPDGLKIRYGQVKGDMLLTPELKSGISAHSTRVFVAGLGTEHEGKAVTFDKVVTIPPGAAGYRIVATLTHRWSGTWPAIIYKHHVLALTIPFVNGVPGKATTTEVTDATPAAEPTTEKKKRRRVFTYKPKEDIGAPTNREPDQTYRPHVAIHLKIVDDQGTEIDTKSTVPGNKYIGGRKSGERVFAYAPKDDIGAPSGREGSSYWCVTMTESLENVTKIVNDHYKDIEITEGDVIEIMKSIKMEYSDKDTTKVITSNHITALVSKADRRSLASKPSPVKRISSRSRAAEVRSSTDTAMVW